MPGFPGGLGSVAEAIDNVAPTLTDDVGKVVESDAHVDGDVAVGHKVELGRRFNFVRKCLNTRSRNIAGRKQ